MDLIEDEVRNELPPDVAYYAILGTMRERRFQFADEFIARIALEIGAGGPKVFEYEHIRILLIMARNGKVEHLTTRRKQAVRNFANNRQPLAKALIKDGLTLCEDCGLTPTPCKPCEWRALIFAAR